MELNKIIFLVFFGICILLIILYIIIIPFWKGFFEKKRELERTITIGEFEISPMRSRDGQRMVWIQSEHEGGEFSTKDLEPFIKDFFWKHF